MMTENSSGLFDDAPPESAPVFPQPADAALKEMMQRLPSSIRLGTSSWNFPGWRGIVWSRGSGLDHLAADGLAAYSASPLFRTVGLDRNFYRPLSASAFAAFARQVPEDFRFLVKAPRDVTDPYLRNDRGIPTGPNPLFLDVHAAAERFLGPVRMGLGKKCGPLVFQFSPLPHSELRTTESRVALIEKIGAFLNALQAPGAGLLLAAEFRNYELLTPRMMKRLREAGVRPVIGLHPAMPGIRRQTEALRFMDAGGEDAGDWRMKGPLIVRWSLAAHRFYDTAKAAWTPFDAIHAADPATRALIASLIVRAARSGKESYLAVNNKAEGCAPVTVRKIAEIADHILEEDRLISTSAKG